MDIAPFRGLRFALGKVAEKVGQDAPVVTAPPYDVLSPEAHQAILDTSPCNIVQLTLGDRPGEIPSYEGRAQVLQGWRKC